MRNASLVRTLPFLGALLVSLSACAHSLKGDWRSECHPYGRHAVVSNLAFSDSEFVATGALYERMGCEAQTVEAQTSGQYKTGASYGEGVEFDFITQTFTLTLLRPDVVEHYNKNKICDFDDWAVGVPKDILGQPNCVGLVPPPKDQELFDILKMKSKNEVQFASFPTGKAATDPQDRPIQIPPGSVVFKKAP